MIRQTFIHLAGIGKATERKLWESGIHDWADALTERLAGIGGSILDRIRAELEASEQALSAGDGQFFANRLQAKHQWRLYPAFADRTAFLDIETTGLDHAGDQITTAAVYDGSRIRTYVRGENLQDLPRDLQEYRLLVTYNGRHFDVPFIEAQNPGLVLNQPHIDLRHVLGALGYWGGLKGCERQMGLARPEGLLEVDGMMAVRLWHAHLRGDSRALPALLRYNIEDAVNLRWLMDRAYNLCVQRLPIPVAPVAEEDRLTIDMPFEASIIEELTQALI